MPAFFPYIRAQKRVPPYTHTQISCKGTTIFLNLQDFGQKMYFICIFAKKTLPLQRNFNSKCYDT